MVKQWKATTSVSARRDHFPSALKGVNLPARALRKKERHKLRKRKPTRRAAERVDFTLWRLLWFLCFPDSRWNFIQNAPIEAEFRNGLGEVGEVCGLDDVTIGAEVVGIQNIT